MTSLHQWLTVKPLSSYIRERKLPFGYHEHICFIDHDMGKIFVFCKSSIFHDLKRGKSEKISNILIIIHTISYDLPETIYQWKQIINILTQ